MKLYTINTKKIKINRLEKIRFIEKIPFGCKNVDKNDIEIFLKKILFICLRSMTFVYLNLRKNLNFLLCDVFHFHILVLRVSFSEVLLSCR
jgi:hypothetical protein